MQSVSSSLASFNLSIVSRIHLLKVCFVSFLFVVDKSFVRHRCKSPESVVENSLNHRFLLKCLSHHHVLIGSGFWQ